MRRVSRFTVVHSLASRGRGDLVIVLNTLTGRSMVISESVWKGVVAAAANGASSTDESTLSTVATLTARGYLVDDTVDEMVSYLDDFDDRRFRPTRINPIIAFTTGCNIACTYCYEEGVRPRTMTKEVVAATVCWLERRIILDGVTEIVPNLFGGEPFLHPDLVLDFMSRVNAMADLHGVTVAYAASSNGILLTDTLAAKLARQKLRQIQISLDGPPSIHDERRVGHRGQPSFNEAVRGISNACHWIPDVTVKVNFDRHNAAHIPQLFDDLVERGLADRLTVKLEAIAYQLPDSAVVHPTEYVIPPESPQMADSYLGLTHEAECRGLRVTSDTAHTTPCMYTSQWGVIIGPDGGISKCISLIGRREHEVGNVLDGDCDRPRYDSAMEVRKKVEDCVTEECAYLPICVGGCSYESAVRGESTSTRFCTKSALERYHLGRQLMRHADRLASLGVSPFDDSDYALPAITPPQAAPVFLPMPTLRTRARRT